MFLEPLLWNGKMRSFTHILFDWFTFDLEFKPKKLSRNTHRINRYFLDETVIFRFPLKRAP